MNILFYFLVGFCRFRIFFFHFLIIIISKCGLPIFGFIQLRVGDYPIYVLVALGLSFWLVFSIGLLGFITLLVFTLLCCSLIRSKQCMQRWTKVLVRLCWQMINIRKDRNAYNFWLLKFRIFLYLHFEWEVLDLWGFQFFLISLPIMFSFTKSINPFSLWPVIFTKIFMITIFFSSRNLHIYLEKGIYTS